MALVLRPLLPSDLEEARALAVAAGLSGAVDYLPHYLRWQPDGYWVGTDGGRLVCMGGALRFGPVAFVGAMAVMPGQQRSGLGGRLLQHLLEDLDRHGVTCTLLEATAAGEGLYARMGFVRDHPTGVFQLVPDVAHRARHGAVHALTGSHTPGVAALDAHVFGADRRAVVNGMWDLCAPRGFVALDGAGAVCGYAMATPQRVGPLLAPSAGVAADLLDALMELPFASGPFLHAPLHDPAVMRLLQRHGARPVRTMTRMRRGGPSPGLARHIWALATAGAG